MKPLFLILTLIAFVGIRTYSVNYSALNIIAVTATIAFVAINLRLLFQIFRTKQRIDSSLLYFLEKKGGKQLARFARRELLVLKSVFSILKTVKVDPKEVSSLFDQNFLEKRELFLGLVILIPIEATCIHLILHQATSMPAWCHLVLAGLEAYALLWATGCYLISYNFKPY